MKLYIAKETEYLPEWNENRSSDEPVKFILKNLTPAERNECVGVQIVDEKQTFSADFEKLFRKGVKRIESLWVDDKEIRTVNEFLAVPGLYDLFIEVASEVLSQNIKVDSKN
jgi:hypothetical protein